MHLTVALFNPAELSILAFFPPLLCMAAKKKKGKKEKREFFTVATSRNFNTFMTFL